MTNLNVLTGATGQLGSHLAEQLVARGERLLALVRPSSDTPLLRRLNVDLAEGDLLRAATLRPALVGADVVYHCAARVSDWGSWKQFEAETVTATGNLLDACRANRVGRLLHVSSISVYGWPRTRGEPITEEAPLGQHLMLWDNYPRAKLLAEQLVRRYEGGWTIVRPSWIYGPRDRISVSRLVPALRQGKVMIVGTGDNLLNIIYAGDVAAGAILAATSPAAVRETYNLSSHGEVTQQKLLDALTDGLGLPRSQARAAVPGHAGRVLPRSVRQAHVSPQAAHGHTPRH